MAAPEYLAAASANHPRTLVIAGTISDSGELQPGYYNLTIIFIQQGSYQWSENGCEGCIESGFRSLDGDMSVEFTISQ